MEQPILEVALDETKPTELKELEHGDEPNEHRANDEQGNRDSRTGHAACSNKPSKSSRTARSSEFGSGV